MGAARPVLPLIGHYAIALYAALIEAGILPEFELETYGTDDSRLPMSGMAGYTPGMEITGGSLGHGLGICVGMCLGLKSKKSSSFVYNLMSDGELGEGSTWEAAMSAAHHGLDNLIAIVDFNDQQADGPSTRMLSSEPVPEKFRAFGWHVQRVDGNDIDAVRVAFDHARQYDGPRPRVVICDTKMCKGAHFSKSARSRISSASSPMNGRRRSRSSTKGEKNEPASRRTLETGSFTPPVEIRGAPAGRLVAAKDHLGDDRFHRRR